VVVALHLASSSLSAQMLPSASGDSRTPQTEPAKDAALGPLRAAQRAQDSRNEPQSRPVRQTNAAASFRWGEHPSVRFGNVRIDLRARVQEDIRRSEAPLEDEDDRLDVARRRVGIDGEVGRVVSFQVERELIGDGVWRDVYVDYRQFDAVRIQAGHFKLPFSLDENTSATSLDFARRSLGATELAPGRDRGVMVHGRFFGRAVSYEAGLFQHDGDNGPEPDTAAERSGRTIALRLTTGSTPRSRSAEATVHAAVAWTGGDAPLTRSAFRGRTPLRSEFFDNDVWVQGPRRRLGIEAAWLPGPASIKAEYMRVTEARQGQSVLETDLAPLVSAAWYVSGTWAITGEAKAEGLDRPTRPFFQGGIGAVELAARVEELTLGAWPDDEGSTSPRSEVVLGNRDRVVTLGVNWYLNRWVKVQANLIRDTLGDPARGPLPSKASYWSRLVRLQLTV
jgi:phosphate-selective porin OprO/OprP